MSTMMFRLRLDIVLLLVFGTLLCVCFYTKAEVIVSENFKIDGKVPLPPDTTPEWISSVRILVDGGKFLGYLKADGSFAVNDVPPGSYLVEVANPTYHYEPVRVDITSKGKIRARKVNNLKSNAVEHYMYPVKFRLLGEIRYFRVRETWRVTDMLFSPMVMMMVLPLVILLVLPKLVNTNDPELQKEMQQSMPKYDMPELSEMMTSGLGSIFGQDKSKTKTKAVKKK